jgi:hypothetical protein
MHPVTQRALSREQTRGEEHVGLLGPACVLQREESSTPSSLCHRKRMSQATFPFSARSVKATPRCRIQRTCEDAQMGRVLRERETPATIDSLSTGSEAAHVSSVQRRIHGLPCLQERAVLEPRCWLPGEFLTIGWAERFHRLLLCCKGLRVLRPSPTVSCPLSCGGATLAAAPPHCPFRRWLAVPLLIEVSPRVAVFDPAGTRGGPS